MTRRRATRTVPIVTGVGDPVGAGFAASLARPGGNITGMSYAVVEATQKRIQLLREAGVPTMFEYPFYVEAGGLMSFRLDFEDQAQRTAAHLDKVFRATSPAQIPFEFPTLSELVVNAGAARAIGLTLPQALLVRADRVIE